MQTVDKISTVDIFCEFFEVLVHNTLYSRRLYPQTIFERKRKYGIVIYQSIHKDVTEYITACIQAVHFHLTKNQLKGIFLCFHSFGRIIEKHYFEILNLKNSADRDPFLLKLEQNLRDFCLKLHSSDSYLTDLPGDSTFSIQLNVTEYSNLEFNQEPAHENFPWVVLNGQETKLTAPAIVPLHTIQTDCLTVQIYIEKSD